MVNRIIALASLACVLALLPGCAGPKETEKSQAGNGSPADAVQEFTVGGIHVILSPADNQLVSVVLGMEGGVVSGETDNPALAGMMADLITTSGCKLMSKDDLRAFTSRTSTSYNGSADFRGVSISMTSTLDNFDKSFDVLTSFAAEPVFDESEFRKVQQQRMNMAKSRWARPEGYAMTLADSLIKRGNPVLSRWVSPEDVSAVSVDKIREFQHKVAERSRVLLVIVGNVKRSDIEAKLQRLSTMPQGTYTRTPIPPIQPSAAPGMQKVDRPSPTAYIYCGFAGPRAGEADWWPMQVGFNYLRDKLFEEVRTKRNLSYAPSGFMQSSLGNGVGYISVSTTNPDSAISVMYTELRKMRTGDIADEEVDMAKQVFTTAYFTGQMTNGGKAVALFSAERNAGTWRFAFSADKIAAVTKADIQRAFAKYAKNLQVGFVGKTQGVTDTRYVFGE